MNKTSENLNFKQISKKIASLALPMAGSQFLNVSSGFLCMAMLAQLGHQVLAASALIFTTQLSIMVSGMSILYSLGILISHSYGAKSIATIGNLVQQGWIVGFLIGIPIMLIFWHMGNLMLLLGQTPEISVLVQRYFQAFVWAVIPAFLGACNMQFGYAVGKQALIIGCSALSIGMLLVSAYALIFGKWGIPAYGVAGLAYAIAIQYTFFVIATTGFFFFKKEYSKFGLFHFIHQKSQGHWEQFKRIFTVGWPICMQMGGEMLSFFVSGVLIGWLGNTALAAFQVVNQYYFLIIIPIFSLSQATGILVGHAKGGEQIEDIKKISHVSIAITLLVSFTVALIFLFFPKQLASIYIDVNGFSNKPTLQLTIILFSIIAFSNILDAIRNVLIGIFRGLLDTKRPMLINLIAIWLFGMPLSYILAFPLHFGAIGFVLGGMAGMLSAVVMMVFRWRELELG